MTILTPSILLSIWERAAQSEFGIAIEVENPETFLLRFYEAREGHPAYANLSVTRPGKTRELFIIKPTVELTP